MHAGLLRDRITIRRPIENKNSGGGRDVGWSNLATGLPAQVINLNGREAIIGNVLQGVALFDITVRYRTDLKPADQLLWNGRELNVIGAEDREGRRQWTVIQASTQAPQGA
jgi:head-tail adaptor